MDGSVAEGNSASHQNPSPTHPKNPLGCSRPGTISNTPSASSDQHVNDLGLTLSPGSQLQQPTGVQTDTSLEEVFDELSNDLNFWDDVGLTGAYDVGQFPELWSGHEAGYGSRKRVRDEAFAGEHDVSTPSEKKRLTDPQISPYTNPSEEPFSLSSPGFQQIDHGEAVSAADSEREMTPDSLFDEPTPVAPRIDDPPVEEPVENSGNENGEVESASVSESTRHRFSLSTQDLESAKTREIFHGFGQQPEYLSPYPVYGGTLGYLPSTPNVHLKCIEVASERVNNQLANYRRKVQGLTYERNKYQTAWAQWNTVDSATGKTREQLIREENRRLRCRFENQEKQIAEWKNEAERWKNHYSGLSATYNSLLYDIYVRNEAGVGENLPAVAPPPQGFPMQHLPAGAGGSMPVPGLQMPTAHSQVQPQMAATRAHASAAHPRATASPPAPVSMPTPVTIDLTSEESDAASHSRYASPHPGPHGGIGGGLRQSFRNKTYNWLGERNHMRKGFQPLPEYAAAWHQGSRRSSSSSQPSHMGSAGYSRPSTADSVQPVQPGTNMSDNYLNAATDQSAVRDEDSDEAAWDDEELARMLEEELAGGV